MKANPSSKLLETQTLVLGNENTMVIKKIKTLSFHLSHRQIKRNTIRPPQNQLLNCFTLGPDIKADNTKAKAAKPAASIIVKIEI